MKPTPNHHKTVCVPFHTVERGYDGARQIRAAGPGLWTIVAASPMTPPPGMIFVVVAPARGGK